MGRPLRWAFFGGLLVAGGTLEPSRVGAQALSGRVVDAVTRRPVAGIPVVLLQATPDDTGTRGAATAPRGAPPDRTVAPRDTTALATAVTGPDGVFLLTAPAPGTYRARIGAEFVTPPILLASAESFEAREYQLAAAPAPAPASQAAPPVGTAAAAGPRPCSKDAVQAALADSSAQTATEDPATGVQTLLARFASRGAGPILCEFQVEKQAAAVRGTLWARYPDELRRLDRSPTRGRVVAQFVVNAHGTADMDTFKVLEASDPAFVTSAWEAVARAQFSPAEIGHHHKVRQLVQLPFTFTLTTGPRRGGP